MIRRMLAVVLCAVALLTACGGAATQPGAPAAKGSAGQLTATVYKSPT